MASVSSGLVVARGLAHVGECEVILVLQECLTSFQVAQLVLTLLGLGLAVILWKLLAGVLKLVLVDLDECQFLQQMSFESPLHIHSTRSLIRNLPALFRELLQLIVVALN